MSSKPYLQKWEESEMMSLYREGLVVEEIAAKVNRSATSVYRVIKRNGLYMYGKYRRSPVKAHNDNTMEDLVNLLRDTAASKIANGEYYDAADLLKALAILKKGRESNEKGL